MKTNEFIHRIENGEAKVLTVEEAKKLKGKKIYWFYFGYSGNENEVQEMKVGENLNIIQTNLVKDMNHVLTIGSRICQINNLKQ